MFDLGFIFCKNRQTTTTSPLIFPEGDTCKLHRNTHIFVYFVVLSVCDFFFTKQSISNCFFFLYSGWQREVQETVKHDKNLDHFPILKQTFENDSFRRNKKKDDSALDKVGKHIALIFRPFTNLVMGWFWMKWIYLKKML